MHQSEIELGLGWQAEIFEGCEECIIAAVLGHRHVNPVQFSVDRRCDAVGKFGQDRRVLGFHNMFVAGIAITQMNTHVGFVWDHVAEPAELLEGETLWVPLWHGQESLAGKNLHANIPLNRQALQWNTLRNGCHVPRYGALICLQEGGPGGRRHIETGHRIRSGRAHLKTHLGRYHACLL